MRANKARRKMRRYNISIPCSVYLLQRGQLYAIGLTCFSQLGHGVVAISHTLLFAQIIGKALGLRSVA